MSTFRFFRTSQVGGLKHKYSSAELAHEAAVRIQEMIRYEVNKGGPATMSHKPLMVQELTADGWVTITEYETGHK